ncbi:MAG: hypothetical protein U0Q22_05815 [Acidimicrobiales bacterium]
MPMREGCKFYESRTYPTGESVRKCDLDLAPEAPWRCPDNCPAYQPRLADVNWSHGSLIAPPTPAEPASVGVDPSIGDLLDEAENIVNAAVERTRAEVDATRPDTSGFRPGRPGGDQRGWRRWFRRG